MANLTREQLEAKTAKDLKNMCVYELDLPGLTKKNKETVIQAILDKYGRKTRTVTKAPISKGAMEGVEFKAQSTLTKPGAPFGHKTTTTVHVSCGASADTPTSLCCGGLGRWLRSQTRTV